ncbi:hypothetical protein BDB00DRAFT_872968 [Zychaea mexicana]|uniref:uncharacterized protein n=1 Tax=Zychaea mexicana TaxID=64656 RepID=UPI0022FE90D1|nr:uncharacterized protein BDB00DRAFT_872968 [Zychaea mexicana]KAI9492923.1 hypothetical protein BDB00DRAFT_872968 [Zychaea mexicana]
MSTPSRKSSSPNNEQQQPPDESSSCQLKSSDATSSSLNLDGINYTHPPTRPRPCKRLPSRRNGTESNSSRISWGWSTWSLKQQRRKSHSALPMLFQQRRRTFPPPSRVLENEKRRFTYGAGSGKKKFVRIRRRHSLAGILSTLKGNGSSSRNQQSGNKHLSVRSSMVLHISDEDAAATDVPEILYGDCIISESMFSTQSSSCQYCNSYIGNSTPNNNSSTCPHCHNQRHHRNYNNIHPPPSSSSSGSRPQQRGRLYTEGNWFYSWVQHHPRRKKNKQRLIRKNSSSNSGGTNNTSTKKHTFIRPPTISDLSSLSNPLSKLDSIIHRNYPHRFSAFWFDTHGRSGKQQVHVDGKGTVAEIRHDTQRWRCSPSTVQSSIFLFGFLFFPLWWVGAWMYLRHPARTSKQHTTESQSSLSFAAPRFIGMLNCWMSCFSVVVVPVLVGLGVWYHYAVRNM